MEDTNKKNRDHAILSASSAHRWMNCSPSARLELEFNDRSGIAALEGSAAHALGEYKLKKALGEKAKRPTSDFDCQEMEDYTDAYVDFILEAIEMVKHSCKDPLILIEKRLDFSKYVPDGFGTGDIVIIADKTLHIIDFKYGQGVLVSAEDNPQMKLYALGALELYDGIYDIENILMTIYQPRRENVSSWEMP